MTDAATDAFLAYSNYLYKHNILNQVVTRKEMAAMLVADLESAFPGTVETSKEFMP